MTCEKYFEDALNNVPADTKLRVEMSMDISDRIASILKRRGLSQKDFAKLMGKTEAEVSRWLGGTHNFTLSTLAKISTSLNERIVTVNHVS